MSTLSERVPVVFCTYPGDQRQILDQGPKGPNTIGEWLWPVEAVYDEKSKKTRVGWSFIAPEQS